MILVGNLTMLKRNLRSSCVVIRKETCHMLVGWFILNLSDDGKYGLVNCRKWDSPELTFSGTDISFGRLTFSG